MEKFEEIYRKYYGRIYAFALTRLHSVDDASDIAQATFLKMYINMDRLVLDKIELWLFTVAAHTITDLVRRRSRSDLSINDIEVVCDDWTHDVELCQDIRSTLSRLSDSEVQILITAYYLGYRLIPQAELLDLDPARLNRLRMKARKSFIRAWNS